MADPDDRQQIKQNDQQVERMKPKHFRQSPFFGSWAPNNSK
jgi:hypothetical protein